MILAINLKTIFWIIAIIAFLIFISWKFFSINEDLKDLSRRVEALERANHNPEKEKSNKMFDEDGKFNDDRY